MSLVKGFSLTSRKNNLQKNSQSPSPLDYSTSRLSRYGKETNPAYSFGSRWRSKSSDTPGPTHYQVSKTDLKFKAGPSYSFGQGKRKPFEVKQDSPAPNMYDLPSTLGEKVPHRDTGRAFSMYGKLKDLPPNTITPGPGAYNQTNLDLYRKKQPGARFLGRNWDSAGKKERELPSPNQYNVMECKIDKFKGRKAPAAAFGIRHSPKVFTVFTSKDVQ